MQGLDCHQDIAYPAQDPEMATLWGALWGGGVRVSWREPHTQVKAPASQQSFSSTSPLTNFNALPTPDKRLDSDIFSTLEGVKMC